MPEFHPEMSSVRRTSGLAIASLVLSCLSVALGPFGFFPGIICGHLARSECRRDPNVDGDGLAVAGLIVGYLFLVISFVVCLVFAVLAILAVFAGSGSAPFTYTIF